MQIFNACHPVKGDGVKCDHIEQRDRISTIDKNTDIEDENDEDEAEARLEVLVLGHRGSREKDRFVDPNFLILEIARVNSDNCVITLVLRRSGQAR